MESKSEFQKMLSGELYDSGDPELMGMRVNARSLLQEYNQLPYERSRREQLLKKLLGEIGEQGDIQTPFYCDYGSNTFIGHHFFANFNCVFLDCNQIRIYVFLGPAVQIYTATHPLDAAERIKGPELAYPVNIGDHVWIGGGAIICPGVRIGSDTTIGAGSVVTKDIPSHVLAAGNPCRVIKKI